MTQLDFGNILSLYLVNTESYHQIRHNLRLTFCFANDLDSLVNVKQNLFKTLEQMQLVCLFIKRKLCSSSNTFKSKFNPFFKDFADAHNFWITFNKYVKITGERIFKRCKLIKLCHKLVRVDAAF